MEAGQMVEDRVKTGMEVLGEKATTIFNNGWSVEVFQFGRVWDAKIFDPSGVCYRYLENNANRVVAFEKARATVELIVRGKIK